MSTNFQRFLLGSGVLLLLACLAPEFLFTPLVLMRPVFFGWLALPIRAVPQIRWEPMMLASALVYAGAFVGGLHVLLGRLTGRRSWRVTGPIAALPLLMFAAGTAAVAVVAEFEGLAGEPVFRERGSKRPFVSRLIGWHPEDPDPDRRRDIEEFRHRTAEAEHDHSVVVFGPDGKVGAAAVFDRSPSRRDFVLVWTTQGGPVVKTFHEFHRIRRDVEAGTAPKF